MADAKSLLHQDLVWTLTIPPARRLVWRAYGVWTLARFEDNGRSTCLHCSSDEGNTRFQPRGFTW